MKAKIIDENNFKQYQGIEFDVVATRQYTNSIGENCTLYILSSDHEPLPQYDKEYNITGYYTCTRLYMGESQIKLFK